MAMTWVALTAMLRISEFTVDNKNQDRMLTMGQLSFTTHSNMKVDSTDIQRGTSYKHATLHLTQSKTDPFRNGADIIIASTEAVDALINYLHQTRHAHITPVHPLFRTRDDKAVNRSWFMKQVTALVIAAGYDMSNYSSHSFRKGGAVSLQEKGVEDSVIRNMGRWKSGAYHLYLRYPNKSTIVQAGSNL
jgi:integrase